MSTSLRNLDKSRFVKEHPPFITEDKSQDTTTKVAIAALLICVFTLIAAPASIAIFNPTVAIAATIVGVSCLVCIIAGIVFGIFLTQDNQLATSYPYLDTQESFYDDSFIKRETSVSLQEVQQYSQGLANPSCNCFMNAMLQNIFSLDVLGDYIITSLETLKQDAFNTNPFLKTFDIHLVQNEGESNQAFQKRKQNLMKQYKNHKPSCITITETNLTDVLKTHFQNKQSIEAFYKALTLKKAATYALEIIKKWRLKQPISFDEAKLLRVAVIKLFNKSPVLVFHNDTPPSDSSFWGMFFKKDHTPPLWEFPGIDRDLKIDCTKQECPAEFFTQFLSSLQELTKTPSPSSFKIDRIDKGYRINDAAGDDWFATRLQVYEKQASENTTLMIHSLLEGQTELNLADLGPFEQSYQKMQSYFEDQSFFRENRPPASGLQTDDLIHSETSYRIKLPEQLFMQIKVNNPDSQKDRGGKRKIALKFTDEKNFRITTKSTLDLKPKTYELQSFVVHKGYSTRSGHYVNYIKHTRSDGSSFWIEQNDALSTPVDLSIIQSLLKGQKGPYMTPYMLAFKSV